MPAQFDAPGRLREGMTAVGDAQEYVQAAHARGYNHPDLTSHTTQIWQWYGADDGMDLSLLDVDCIVLNQMSLSAEEGAALVRQRVSAAPEVWSGNGGMACIDFLVRHADSAIGAAAGIQSAARAYAILRDELWRIVDAKVSATLELAAAAVGQRDTWLAAARAVQAGDHSDATAIVIDEGITPFVNDAVAGRWLPAMRTAEADAQAAYRAALATLNQYVPARFEVPGELAPMTVPAAVQAANGAPSANEPVAPTAVAEPAPNSPVAQPDLGAISAIPGRIADLIDALVGDAVPEPEGTEPSEDTETEAARTEDTEPAPVGPTHVGHLPEPAGSGRYAAEAPTPIAPIPEGPPPQAAQPETAPPDPATPCELAADELPQVGR